MSSIKEQVQADIEAERARQDAKFGEQSHTPLEWLAVLGEEVGEANHAVVEVHFKRYRGATWDNYRNELVHIAAVAIAALECLDGQARWRADLIKGDNP